MLRGYALGVARGGGGGAGRVGARAGGGGGRPSVARAFVLLAARGRILPTGWTRLASSGPLVMIRYDTDSSFRRPTPRPVAPFIPHSLRMIVYTPRFALDWL